MLLIKCYRITNYQRRFINDQITNGLFFSSSEIIRHAAILFLTVIEKRGYLPDGIFPDDPLVGNTAGRISTKFPINLMDQILDTVMRYNLTFSSFIRIALDNWIQWFTGMTTFEQENYIQITEIKSA